MKPVLRYLVAALLFYLPTCCGAVEVITNLAVPTENITRGVVRSIFSMRITSWPSGMPIRVFVLGDKSDLHASFSKRILGVFPHQLRRAWNRQIFSGTGQAPERVESEREMIDKVANTPGAIGYISEEMINAQIRKLAVE